MKSLVGWKTTSTVTTVMAATTCKYQSWDSANYDFSDQTAGKPLPEVIAELDTWITAINGNASQSGKQVVRHRDGNSSTAANNFGFVIETPAQTTTGSLYTMWKTSATTNATIYTGTGYQDDTTNNGYGTILSQIDSDPSLSFLLTVSSQGSFITASSTVNGEEFFVWGWFLDTSTSYADFICFFKDTDGEWVHAYCDSTDYNGVYYDGVQPTPGWRQIIARDSGASTNGLQSMTFTGAVTGISIGDLNKAQVVAKSPDILMNNSGSFTQGDYFSLTDGSGDQCILVNNYGPWIIYTP